MDRATSEPRLQDSEAHIRRLEENVAFQQQIIAKLEQGGHDVRAANLFLNRLKALHAKLTADPD